MLPPSSGKADPLFWAFGVRWRGERGESGEERGEVLGFRGEVERTGLT